MFLHICFGKEDVCTLLDYECDYTRSVWCKYPGGQITTSWWSSVCLHVYTCLIQLYIHDQTRTRHMYNCQVTSISRHLVNDPPIATWWHACMEPPKQITQSMRITVLDLLWYTDMRGTINSYELVVEYMYSLMHTNTHKMKHKQEDVFLWIAFVANTTNRSLVCYLFKVMSVHGRCCFIVQSVDCGVCASWLLVHPLCAGFWQECVLLLQGLVCWHSVFTCQKLNICWYSYWGCW